MTKAFRRPARSDRAPDHSLRRLDADSATPLVETLIASVGRLRRGMTAVVITASMDPSWVRPLAALRSRGVGCVVVCVDANAFAAYERSIRAAASGNAAVSDPAADEAAAKRARALRHALSEYELRAYTVGPARPTVLAMTSSGSPGSVPVSSDASVLE